MNEVISLLPILLAIVITEIVLSLDNAVVLANMIKHLPKSQQKKALTYGILGAYLFRGLSIFFVVILTTIAWIKVVGGLYLLYIAVQYFRNMSGEEEVVDSHYGFWGTVALVEVMDMVFSIDNILGAVAFTDVLWIVIMGVFIGILTIRFAAGKLVGLLIKYPQLETAAHLVIGLLGVKLIFSYFYPHFFESPSVSIAAAVSTFVIFGSALIFKKK